MYSQHIEIRPSSHFSFKECLWFLDRGYDDCCHQVIGDSVWKAVRIGAEQFLIRLTGSDDVIKVDIVDGTASLQQQQTLKTYVDSWFDAQRGLDAFYHVLSKDTRLSYMARDFYGLRLIGIVDLFEALCWGIIGQQINLSFAYRLKRRVVERFGTSIMHEGRPYHIFPSPQALAAASIEELKSMQFSNNKASYLIDIAKDFATGNLSKERLMALPDAQSRQKLLLQKRGIGLWTANYTLMKALQEPSMIPFGDAGMLQAMVRHGLLTDKKSLAQIQAFFKPYKGYETYMVLYLWRSNALKKV